MNQLTQSTRISLGQASFYLQLVLALLEKAGESGTAPRASGSGDTFQPLSANPTPDPGQLGDSDSEATWQLHAISTVRAGDYLTNDIVEVRGAFERQSNWELKVNGGAPLKLGRRGFVLLKILSAFSVSLEDLARQGKVKASQYLTVPTIVGTILVLTAEGAPLAGFWPAPIESDVHKSVHKLRRRLRAAGWPSLIESGQRGAGYRLSTPAANIVRSGDENAWIAAVRQALKTEREA